MTTPTTANPLPIQITLTRDAIRSLLDALLRREGLTFEDWVELRAIALDPASRDVRRERAQQVLAEVSGISAGVTAGIPAADLELTGRVLATMAEQARRLAVN